MSIHRLEKLAPFSLENEDGVRIRSEIPAFHVHTVEFGFRTQK